MNHYCTEEWLPVVGFEGRYMVSSLGRVKSLHPQRGDVILKQHIRRHSYLSVRLYHGPKTAQRYTIHRLVLEAFVGPCPLGHEGCHSDGDPQNNAASNLYWGTRRQNMDDIRRHGRNFQTRKTHCVNGHAFTLDNTRIAKDNGQRVCITCVRERCRRYYWQRKAASQ